MPIIDNRILIADAESLAPGSGGDWIDDADSTMAIALDTDTFIEGVSSAADRLSSSRGGIGWREDADRDWSGNVFYVWWRSDVAGKLGTKAAAGVTMRFTGATVTDWFEVNIDGSDTYGGGFKMSVVDIDKARELAVEASPSTDGATNGTPPATTAIRRILIVFDVLSSAPGGADNHFVDAMWRLPAGEPGIIVEGNAGSSPEVPYNWLDIVEAGDNSDPAKAWGMISQSDGVIKINAPIQFGSSNGLIPVSPDPGNHKFSDLTRIIAWESQLVADGFYGFTIVADNANVQLFQAGQLAGEVGALGWVVTAAEDGPRWFIKATDGTLQEANFFGCLLLHSGVIDIDSKNADMRNCALIDGQRLIHSR